MLFLDCCKIFSWETFAQPMHILSLFIHYREWDDYKQIHKEEIKGKKSHNVISLERRKKKESKIEALSLNACQF